MDFVFCNDTATTEIYPLALHNALPIPGGAGTACGTGKCPGFRVAPGSPGIRRSGARPNAVAPASYRSNVVGVGSCQSAGSTDRKSTRLNSSHANISYAVFCLKKKNSIS